MKALILITVIESAALMVLTVFLYLRRGLAVSADKIEGTKALR